MTLGRQGHAVCHGGKIGPCHWRSLRLRSTRSSRWKYRLPFTDGFFRWVSNSHAINAFGNAVQRCLGSLELALIRGITDPPTVGWLAHDFRFFLIWFFRKKREVGEKFHVFRAKGCLKNTCWTCSKFSPLRLPLLGCSTGLFSSNLRGENSYGSTHTLPCLWSCMCLELAAKKSGHQSSAFQNGGTENLIRLLFLGVAIPLIKSRTYIFT